MPISWAVALIMQLIYTQLDYEVKLQRIVGEGLASVYFCFFG